jgi:hypothetical protein
MNHPGPKRVLAQIRHLENAINRMKMVPANQLYRNAVLLGLTSKALTVGRAVCLLVEEGFLTEAFGLSRTMVEIYFCVRYIGNKDSESRATTYVEYQARVQQEWSSLAAKYYPTHPAASFVLDRHILETAKKFPHKGSWTGRGGQAKMMALEEDTREPAEDGDDTLGFDYDFVYFWTSHFVHATVAGLEGHGSTPGEPFRVRPQRSQVQRYARLSLMNVVASLLKIFVSAFRAMNEEQPEEVQQTFRMLSKF